MRKIILVLFFLCSVNYIVSSQQQTESGEFDVQEKVDLRNMYSERKLGNREPVQAVPQTLNEEQAGAHVLCNKLYLDFLETNVLKKLLLLDIKQLEVERAQFQRNCAIGGAAVAIFAATYLAWKK